MIIKAWKNLKTLTKSLICLTTSFLLIFTGIDFIVPEKITSTAIVITKDKEPVYKGSMNYIMCLRQVGDNKIYSVGVGYTTYALFESGDTVVFKLNKDQVYPETKSLVKPLLFLFSFFSFIVLFVISFVYFFKWGEELTKAKAGE